MCSKKIFVSSLSNQYDGSGGLSASSITVKVAGPSRQIFLLVFFAYFLFFGATNREDTLEASENKSLSLSLAMFYLFRAAADTVDISPRLSSR